ncbi:LLM class flavin-dependent oxidoreductase [Nakamurella sp. YIM 132087]|uniref:LLM class flavin-dependent oxidoreductase n=1 Tax=Nakamurella alba TaxID=2665158 RepID=A0A7K1FF48_9ACTN|nr:LLM class flavin-dependent oxidoreductase [Nakamurella alba]MTD12727.1 LLM class flavin-dependent oxidoreductase [Nakamurella alba]
MTAPALPDPALIVLAGAAGAGKSFWAASRYRSTEIVSSDALRAMVGSGPADLDASTAAFDVLERIVTARIGRGLTTVVDTLGFDAGRRIRWRELAAGAGLPAVLVLLDTPAALCRSRNRSRDRPVPAPVLTAQLHSVRELDARIDDEGWDLVIRVIDDGAAPAAVELPADAAPAGPGADGPEVILQLSRFPWDADPAGWLAGIATAATESGLAGIALMDHLIQIPQVGRAWDPIPDPFVTLGLLAGLPGGLKLGTLVSPVTIRPGGVLAKAISTLDVLTGGRAFCGIGAGWWDREHRAFGLPFPEPGARLDAVEAAITGLRAWWGPGTKALETPAVRLPETTCYPRPLGSPPIIVGGTGRRTLRIAGALADGCNVPADDQLPARIAAVRDAAAGAGRAPADVSITVLDLPVLGEDREDVARRVEKVRGRTPAAQYVRRHPAGTAAEHAARYRDLAEQGVSTVFLALPDLYGPDDVHRLAPLVAALR